MKRFALALAAVAGIALVAIFSTGPAGAQSAPGGGQGAAARQAFAKMLLSLNLSDGQKTQIRAIMATARAKAKTQTDFQAKRDTLRDANKQIETVLTPPQKDKLRAERTAYFKAHGGPPGGGNPGGGSPNR